MNILYAAAALIVVVGALTGVSLKYYKSWEERDIKITVTSWRNVFLMSAAAATFSAGLALALGGQWWQAGIASLLGWLLPFVVVTDYSTYKIPMEPSIAAYLLPLLIAVPLTWGNSAAYWQVGLWFVLPVLLIFVYSIVRGGGFGMADMRLLILAGTGLSWWVGYDWMLYAFAASALIQFGVLAYLMTANKSRRKAYGIDEQAVSSQEADELTVTDGKKRRIVTPFGPALVVAFLILTFVAIAAERTACSVAGGIYCL